MPTNSQFARDGLHYFRIHAVARKGNKHHPAGSGAHVSCWVNFRLYEGALELAKFYVKKAGWSVQSVSSHAWLNGPSHAARGTVRYYREALRVGASFVFHEYQANEP
jgi:hypothetical protein